MVRILIKLKTNGENVCLLAKNWVVLRRHRDEDVLNMNFATFSWPVLDATKPARYFRILQTGHNSSNHNFLSVGGIELYGELYENDEQTLDSPSPILSSSSPRTSLNEKLLS
jgi:hypothetical protein